MNWYNYELSKNANSDFSVFCLSAVKSRISSTSPQNHIRPDIPTIDECKKVVVVSKQDLVLRSLMSFSMVITSNIGHPASSKKLTSLSGTYT